MSKVIITLPAYNAASTIEKTIKDIPLDISKGIILVDDGSSDNTIEIANKIGITVFKHGNNKGYGANQKTCYRKALEADADIVIMLHPDYQYDSTRIPELIRPILEGREDMMFGSRIRTRREALAGGMPPVKYILNRLYCVLENIILGTNYSEFFSGFRAYNRKLLETLPLESFSDDFVFDQELMISALAYGFRVGETPVPVRYFSEASSIRFLKGTKFLLATLGVLAQYVLYKNRIHTSKIFKYNKP